MYVIYGNEIYIRYLTYNYLQIELTRRFENFRARALYLFEKSPSEIKDGTKLVFTTQIRILSRESKIPWKIASRDRFWLSFEL